MKPRYVFVITSLQPWADKEKVTRERVTEAVVAERFQDVLVYCARQLADPEVEIESIHRYDPIVTIIVHQPTQAQ